MLLVRIAMGTETLAVIAGSVGDFDPPYSYIQAPTPQERKIMMKEATEAKKSRSKSIEDTTENTTEETMLKNLDSAVPTSDSLMLIVQISREGELLKAELIDPENDPDLDSGAARDLLNAVRINRFSRLAGYEGSERLFKFRMSELQEAQQHLHSAWSKKQVSR